MQGLTGSLSRYALYAPLPRNGKKNPDIAWSPFNSTKGLCTVHFPRTCGLRLGPSSPSGGSQIPPKCPTTHCYCLNQTKKSHPSCTEHVTEQRVCGLWLGPGVQGRVLFTHQYPQSIGRERCPLTKGNSDLKGFNWYRGDLFCPEICPKHEWRPLYSALIIIFW